MSLRSFMGRIFAATKRATKALHWDDPSYWQPLGVNSVSTVAGVQVNPEKALTLAAYLAALRAISEDIAKLPLQIYRRLDRGKEVAKDHPLYRLIHIRPNPWMSSSTLRETLTANALSWGGGYAEIARDGSKPSALLYHHPSLITLKKSNGEVVPEGTLFYELKEPGEQPRSILAPDMIHLKNFGDNGMVGLSIAKMAAQSLGISIAAETFAGAFFGNGANYGGVVEAPPNLSDKAYKRMKRSFEQAGGPGNAHRVRMLEEGSKFTKISIPPEEAQFLETRQFQVEEVARWFRIPPHKLQQLLRATFSNIEQQSIEYVVDTLLPWLIRWEQEIAEKLFADDPDYFVEHKIEGLLRGDSITRGTFYTSLFRIGVFSINEIRELENMNQLDFPGADDHYIPKDLASVENPPEPEPTPPPAPSVGMLPPPEEGGQDTGDMGMPGTEEAIAMILRREVSSVASREEKVVSAAIKRGSDDPAKIAKIREIFETQQKYLAEALGEADKIMARLGYRVSDIDQVARTYRERAQADVLRNGPRKTYERIDEILSLVAITRIMEVKFETVSHE